MTKLVLPTQTQLYLNLNVEFPKDKSHSFSNITSVTLDLWKTHWFPMNVMILVWNQNIFDAGSQNTGGGGRKKKGEK